MAGSDTAGPKEAVPRPTESTAQSSWTVWQLEASVTVTDPGTLAAAEGIVRDVVAAVDLACSRFRSDSELLGLQPRMARGVTVSPMFRLLLERALDAAAMTNGDVDPTLGADLAALGHGPGMEDRQGLLSVEVSPLPASSEPPAPRVPGWSRLRLDSTTLTLPADLRLDLGASAKAMAADLAAAAVHRKLGCGVLVSLGGDVASAGPGPQTQGKPGQWQILVQDLPADPAQQISVAPGFALATSSTQKRRWTHQGTHVHHILDPRFGLPAETVWRSVTVAAQTCLEANAFSTAAIVRGFAAVEWFRAEGIPARLVDSRGRVTTTGTWPAGGAGHG
ncbi:FAD:protein FMN transferase [Arthrobacter sp. B1I2]|uniref:FAD:protein FMN transferase n=1 Tax=Arthrobacter sp. B1I2 TaxID=3042263 RepID=UPI002789881B|nr:FAD:protein FMN transferase [Arthrobacter sp. B1I2]MDQ0732781.1 thiamine biosynthesis lipoprotein [Arthrobacter sp. B1I2]